jgi:hypothetical protein
MRATTTTTLRKRRPIRTRRGSTSWGGVLDIP